MFLPLAHVVHLDHGSDFRWRFAGLLAGGFLLLAYWLQWVRSPFQWDLAIALTFLFGYRTFTKAFQDLAARKISADQAVIVAALAALYVGEYLAAAEVVYIMLVGETLEEYTARKFQSDLHRLLSCLPHHAHVLRAGVETRVPVEQIRPGDQVIIYPGQRIPVDGKILEGESLVDESSITGESIPRERLQGEAVYAGTLNQSSRLLVEARQVGESTVLSRIVQLVRHAKENKAPLQRTADRYAQWFLPLVLAIAIVCYLVTGDIMRSVAILIVACPCAMVLATPAAVLASVSFLARRGIVVKGGVQLETLAKVDAVAFDKTGTLTRGRPELLEVLSFNGMDRREILAWAASLESHSEHLLAAAIRESAEAEGISLYPTRQVQRHAGLGMEGIVETGVAASAGEQSRHVVLGSARFLEQNDYRLAAPIREVLERLASQGTISVLLGEKQEVVGILAFRDTPRPEASSVLHQLEHLGIHKSLLLTGDNEKAARQVARSVGIAEVQASLLPEEKLNRLQEMKRQGYTVAMVGDGVNDSPSLAAADVGVAMGDTGTDIAADAAGVVLMGEQGLARLPELIRVSRRTVQTIQDNIFWFGLVVNLAAVLAAFLGYLSAIAAAVLHQISSFLVLLNSLRLLNDATSHNLGDRLAEVWRRRQEGLVQGGKRLWETVQTSPWARDPLRALAHTSLLVSFLYALTGLTVVGPRETAVVTRFGQVVEEGLAPGLHYRLPWPVEQVYRLEPQRIRALEIGFRTSPTPTSAEPPAYDWNLQHRQGRYVRESEEAQMLTGDEYLLEVNTVVHYSVEDPTRYLFQASDLEGTLRAVAEGALRQVVAGHPMDQILALDRGRIEGETLDQMRRETERLDLGVLLHSVHLQDVHPALEVVGSFREVASAMEEKVRMINEAEAYANERLPLARGESQKRIIQARQYQLGRTLRAAGEAERFTARERTYRRWPQTTAVRLYLETIDRVLADKTKYIFDESAGRRKLMLLEDRLLPAIGLPQDLQELPPANPEE